LTIPTDNPYAELLLNILDLERQRERDRERERERERDSVISEFKLLYTP